MDVERLAAAQGGDREAFAALVDPYRRELQAHCYRMLASSQDAEDVLQETLLAAWVGLDGFEGRSSLRTWLYRIATHRCLNARRSSGRRAPVADAPATSGAVAEAPATPSGHGEVLWLQPYPDALLDGLPDAAPGPEARHESAEAISLAFVTAVQLLAPRQRAVLLLRDVLGFRAREAADLLDLSEDAVTSALSRARATLAAHRSSRGLPTAASGPVDAELLDRFVTAFVGEDVDALVALLADEVWVRMPPLPYEYHGRAAARDFFRALDEHRRSIAAMVPVGVNRQPAWGEYVRDPRTGALHLVGLLVAATRDGHVSELTHFESGVAAAVGLPRVR